MFDPTPGNCQRCKASVKDTWTELYIFISTKGGKIDDPGNICKKCVGEVREERANAD